MAKQQTFADKAKKKRGADKISVKVVKAEKNAKGTYKFNEKFVKVDAIDKVTEIK